LRLQLSLVLIRDFMMRFLQNNKFGNKQGTGKAGEEFL
jgi:hypothetical protein